MSELRGMYSVLVENEGYISILVALRDTLILTCCSVILGLVVGVLLAFVRVKYRFNGSWRLGNKAVACFVQIFRGTPVMLQLLILSGLLAPLALSPWFIAILGFGLNSSAYVSEILRASVGEIDASQYESACVLGFSDCQTLRLVVLPQALKNSVPTLLNEFCSLLKETAVAGVVGFRCLAQVATAMHSNSSRVWPFVTVGSLYFIVTLVFSYLVSRISRVVTARRIRREQHCGELTLECNSCGGKTVEG
jgi:His/Glu/Gln/Arg/opine family amino acid ABC transporter permease subunit